MCKKKYFLLRATSDTCKVLDSLVVWFNNIVEEEEKKMNAKSTPCYNIVQFDYLNLKENIINIFSRIEKKNE